MPGHGVYGVEQVQEVLFGVDVFFPVRAQQDVFPFFEAEAAVDIRGLDFCEVLMKDFRHRGACDVCALPRQSALRQVPPRMLAVGHVHIGNDVDYPAVRLLRKALVLAAVTCLHVEDGDVQAFRAYHAQAAVGVPEDKDCVRLRGDKEFVAAVDDVPAGGAEIIPYRIHIDLGIVEFEIPEEDSVQVVVIVLSRMGQNHIEVPAAFVDDGCQTDDFRACADYDYKLESAVVLEFYI